MGERFGDYELLKKIATGGMAEIYLARLSTPDGFGRPVVVKRMLPQLAVREDFVTMFLDEARLAANLGHPNVVQVFNLGEQDGAYFMAMELVDGPHLGALFAHSLRQRKPLPVEYCVYVVARAADGLDYAHDLHDPATGQALGIVHRDISPQNVLVSRHGDVKVTDFGVAKAATQEAKTRTGIIKGKVSYMSPEQCLGEKVDRRTDVFALGIVLYELLTRRRLFRDKSDLLVMQRITSEEVKPPSTLNPSLDPELDAVCAKALAKRREERYASAADLSEALDFWLATNGHADARGSLSRWMGEHAPGLGLQVDAETSEPGSRPSWLDAPITGGSGPAETPGKPDDSLDDTIALSEDDGLSNLADNTVSTPALSSAALQSDKGLPDRRAEHSDPDATLVAAEPEAAVSLGHQVTEPSAEAEEELGAEEKTSPEGDSLPALERPWQNQPAPGGEEEARRRPLAAAVGVGLALFLALAAGVVMFGGDDDAEALAKADPVEVDPTAPSPEPTPAPPVALDAGGAAAADPEPDEAPVTESDGGLHYDDQTEEPAPQKLAEDGVRLVIKTKPSGVPLEIGEKKELARSPWEGRLPKGKVEVRALFMSGAVERELSLDDEDRTLVIDERVPLRVDVRPGSARWSLEGPDLKESGSGDVKLGPSLVPGKTYQLSADAPGHLAKKIELVAKPGQLLREELRLARRPSRPTPSRGEGRLRLFAEPFVKVRIAGRTLNAPVRGEEIRAGSHWLIAFNPTLGIKQRFRVTIGKNRETVVKLRWSNEGGTWKNVKADISRPQ